MVCTDNLFQDIMNYKHVGPKHLHNSCSSIRRELCTIFPWPTDSLSKVSMEQKKFYSSWPETEVDDTFPLQGSGALVTSSHWFSSEYLPPAFQKAALLWKWFQEYREKTQRLNENFRKSIHVMKSNFQMRSCCDILTGTKG